MVGFHLRCTSLSLISFDVYALSDIGALATNNTRRIQLGKIELPRNHVGNMDKLIEIQKVIVKRKRATPFGVARFCFLKAEALLIQQQLLRLRPLLQRGRGLLHPLHLHYAQQVR